MLRIKNIKLVISKTRIVIITIYFVIIKSAIAENDFSVNRISSFKVVVSVKSSTFITLSTFAEGATFSIRKLIIRQFIIFTKATFFVKETSFNKTFRIATMNEYRSSHINIKNVIVFVFLKMKKAYNARHQFIFFKVKDRVNLRLYRGYKVFIITSKKIKS